MDSASFYRIVFLYRLGVLGGGQGRPALSTQTERKRLEPYFPLDDDHRRLQYMREVPACSHGIAIRCFW